MIASGGPDPGRAAEPVGLPFALADSGALPDLPGQDPASAAQRVSSITIG
jgi:hypothetical protein